MIGPAVLGWVHLDASIQVLSDLGLGMLLFLAGLEIDPGEIAGAVGSARRPGLRRLDRARPGLRLPAQRAFGLGTKPVFLMVVLVSTSAGLLLPLLKDAGEHDSTFGQVVMTAAALAEIGSVVMLSLLFSADIDIPRPTG